MGSKVISRRQPAYAEAYADSADYLVDVIRLVELRLTALETARDHSLTAAAGAYGRADELERQVRARVDATLREERVIGLEFAFETFGLHPFERHCVMMALAPELDALFSERYALLQGGGRRLPAVGFCIEAFTGDAAERRVLAARGFSAAREIFFPDMRADYLCSELDLQLKLDRRMLDFAAEIDSTDEKLDGLLEIAWPWEPPPPMLVHDERPGLLQTYHDGMEGKRILLLHGAPGSGRLLSVRHCCAALATPLLMVDARRLPDEAEQLERLLLCVFRESVLRHGVVCLTHFDAVSGAEDVGRLAAVERALRRGPDTLFLITEEKWKPDFLPGGYTFLDIAVESPGSGERILLWQTMLEGRPVDDDVSVPELAAKFSFTAGQIKEAVEMAALLARGEGGQTLNSRILHRACRERISHNLGERASLIPVKYTWQDLILPPAAKRMLRNACDQVRYYHKVYGEWGFGDKIAYGRGISMLFSGPPGTGKTMGAQVIAGELQLELYKVDLSAVVSKYIGETEKNLNAVFAEVKKSQSILFFDEADALFGKRSEVKDSHDKHANAETAYLLQKMEEYEGVVVLASNFLQNFDEAFKRRIKFVVEFPFPDAEYRQRMWRAVFPAQTPLALDIDYPYLAETFQLSGSGIKNVAVSAAFLAARAQTPVDMRHILEAVITEMRKAGKNLLKEDLREYYYILDQAEA